MNINFNDDETIRGDDPDILFKIKIPRERLDFVLCYDSETDDLYRINCHKRTYYLVSLKKNPGKIIYSLKLEQVVDYFENREGRIIRYYYDTYEQMMEAIERLIQ